MVEGEGRPLLFASTATTTPEAHSHGDAPVSVAVIARLCYEPKVVLFSSICILIAVALAVDVIAFVYAGTWMRTVLGD